MAFTITDNGDGTSTVTWTVTAETAKVLAVATDAGKYIYPIRWQLYDEQEPPQPIPWGSLTAQQKLDVADREIRFFLVEEATAYHINDARDTAAETAQEEAGTLYDI